MALLIRNGEIVTVGSRVRADILVDSETITRIGKDLEAPPNVEIIDATVFFIKQGTLASLEGQKYPLQTFSADSSLFLTDAPVAVLVNRGTYGAPEITAAAIEDLKRGDVVGEHTFGEGTVQKTIDLPDGAGLMLTVAKYEDPDGKKIQEVAVTPNVVVASPEDDGEPMPPSNGDAPLNQALSLLKAKNG